MTAPRIAGLHVPGLLLLAHLDRPEDEGRRPFAVVDPSRGRGGGEIRAVCALAAAEGVRPGQGLSAAEPLCPKLTVLAFEPERVDALQTRLLEVAAAFSPGVEDGRAVADPDGDPDGGLGIVRLDARGLGHLHPRPEAFLDALCRAAGDAGLRGAAAALADGPFTAAVLAARLAGAWAGPGDAGTGKAARPAPARGRAATSAGVLRRTALVPPGADRRALAGLPLASLHAPEVPPLPDDVLTRLRILSVRTGGAFAALPASAVERRFGATGRRLHRLVGGETRRPLCPWRPSPAFSRSCDPDPPITRRPDLEAHLDRLLADLEADLRGAGRSLETLAVRCEILRGPALRRQVDVLDSSSDANSWMSFLKPILESWSLPGPVARLTIDAARTTGRVRRAPDLFAGSGGGRPPGDGSSLAPAATRLQARLGTGCVGIAALDDRHRPEAAFHLETATVPQAAAPRRREATGGTSPDRRPPADGLPLALRLDTPRPAAVETDAHGRPRRVDGRPAVSAGPFPFSGEWWAAPYDRLYYEVVTDTAALWLFRDRFDGHWYVHGAFD